MSDPLDDLELPRRRPTRRTLIWSLWGRETVKDFVLIFAAIPVLCVLIFVPKVAADGGSWPRLIALLVVFAAIWWGLRVVLRRWVTAGDAGDGGGEPPSPG